MKLRRLDRRLVILVTIVAIAGRLALAAAHLEASHDRRATSPAPLGTSHAAAECSLCAAASGARGFAVVAVSDPRPPADTIEVVPTSGFRSAESPRLLGQRSRAPPAL